VGVITTDANGNLASDGGAMQQSILANTTAIGALDQRLSSFDLRLENFGLAVDDNSRRINDVEGGLAAVAAIPDAYLDSSESYAISGGFSVVNGKAGFGGTVTVRGNDRWSFGASVGHSNGETAGKVQFRFAN
jgi:hypothetical protein